MMLPFRSLAARLASALPSAVARPFTTSAVLAKSANLPPRPKPPPEEDLEEKFVKGSGPGGQKINKTNSACQLKHIPTGIVVKSQATRSRSQNRQIARSLLAARLDEINNGANSRAAAIAEKKKRRRANRMNKSNKKYRALEKEKRAAEEAEGELEGEEGQAQEQGQVEAGPGKDDKGTAEKGPGPGTDKPAGGPE